MLPSFPGGMGDPFEDEFYGTDEERASLFKGVNGINGETGDYGLPELNLQELELALAQKRYLDEFPPGEEEERKSELQGKTTAAFPVIAGLDSNNLGQVGWGVIFASDEPGLAEIREALKPLLNMRHSQAGGTYTAGGYYREFSGDDGFRDGQTKNDWLARFGVGPGPVNPKNGVPYYLLIVGDPERIPYDFQYQLDTQFAVGRIHFDTPQEYASYARTVVAAEQGHIQLPRTMTFFGVKTQGDRATELSSQFLIDPLIAEKQHEPDWKIDAVRATEATKARLAQLLGGPQTPALLFTASHGMEFREPQLQLKNNGALLCQDWPGPIRHRGAIPEGYYFGAGDVGDEASLAGLVAFFFACYGAGTPKNDEFFHAVGKASQIAEKAFLASLPRRLLGHPKGGALAVIGHVERAWGYSFLWARRKQIEVFSTALTQMMVGDRLGFVTETMNIRYAELAVGLSQALEAQKSALGGAPTDAVLGELWTANADARNYVLIGDPAVRLPVSDVAVPVRPDVRTLKLDVAAEPPPVPAPVRMTWREGTPEAEALASMLARTRGVIAVSADGRFMVTSDGGGQARLWEGLRMGAVGQGRLFTTASDLAAKMRTRGGDAWLLAGLSSEGGSGKSSGPAPPARHEPAPTPARPAPAPALRRMSSFSASEADVDAEQAQSDQDEFAPRSAESMLEGGVDFGLFSRRKEDNEAGSEEELNLQASLRISLDDFGKKLATAFEDLTSLEVQSFTSTNLPGVAYDPETRSLSGPVKLRAITRVSLDGDTLVCLPEDEHGAVDREIWELHETMVARAQEHRAKMVQTAADALASLFRAIRGG